MNNAKSHIYDIENLQLGYHLPISVNNRVISKIFARTLFSQNLA